MNVWTKLVRYSAIACSLAALGVVAAWLFAGAPNVPQINILTDPLADAYDKVQGQSISWWAIWGLAQVSPITAHLLLFILSISVATAALLSLVLLLRREDQDATRYLGIGLGWWSASVSYLGIFITVTPFMSYNRAPLALRLAVDIGAFLLLLAAAYAVVAFWERFPRDVSEDELDHFLAAPRSVATARGTGWRGWLRAGPRNPEASWRRRRWVHRLRIGLAVYAVGSMGLLWRGNIYVPDYLPPTLDLIFSLTLMASNLGCIYVLGLPVFKCLRLLRFHRAVGSPEDRARIEWIWTAIWIAVILCLVPAVVAPVLYLAAHWFPELVFDFGWLGTYLLVVYNLAPFIVLVALALTVFYRGAIDPRLALRGFTVWTVLGVLLTLVFVFIERMVATRVVLMMHLPPQTGYVTAGAIVAATFQPIRKRVEKGVNRFVERVLPETLLAAGRRAAAAVAVVDLTGFTALSAQDEQSAIVASALVQKEARRLAEAHDGRVVKSTGDGVILQFKAAAACLEAVQELHRVVAARAAGLDLPALSLHSGLNWGEVVELHDGDIYGMTVNVAARLADWAQAGEIGVSEAFVVALPAPAAGFENRGPQQFKNVPQPVVCLKLAIV